jgi:type IX secretion system PorP/SprF family membrane protein
MTMRKLQLISAVLLLSTSLLKAQQLPQYSQYMVNDFAMNPAIAGTQPYFEACSDNRYQWVGITDAPRTYMLTFNGPITEQHIGIGTYVFTDITGPTRRIGFTTSYSYHLKITDGLNVSFGLSAGLLQFAVDGSQITLDEPGDQALTSQMESVIVPDLGAGIYIYGKHYYLGAAAPQIIESQLKLTSFSSAQNELATHYYITGGYNFDLGPNFSLDPCCVFKYVYPAPLQVDLSARLLFIKKFWIGGGYRTMDAAYAMVGYVYQDNLTFGYSYDYPLSDIQKYSFGTNEIFIGIKFNRSKDKATSKAQM